jgi:iron complex transport system ATP-binding protein
VASGSVEEVIQAQVLSYIYETPFRVVEMEGKLMCLYHT